MTGFPEGETVLRLGEIFTKLYLIRSGVVRVMFREKKLDAGTSDEKPKSERTSEEKLPSSISGSTRISKDKSKPSSAINSTKDKEKEKSNSGNSQPKAEEGHCLQKLRSGDILGFPCLLTGTKVQFLLLFGL